MSPHNLISQLGLPNKFPVFFPAQLEGYRRSLAEAADVPDEFGIAFMLAAAATATGGDVSAVVQSGWFVRCNVFIAVIAPKGAGKSVLAEKCLAPLLHREDELRDEVKRPSIGCRPESDNVFDTNDVDDNDDEYRNEFNDEGNEEDSLGRPAPSRRDDHKQPDPCLVVNDATGPALLQLLDRNPRQLLAHTDELSALFIRNSGGTDRQMWCELFDGRRRRRARASSLSDSTTLAAPYVSIVGSVQPGLMKFFYNARGDDGLLDRLLLVGDGVTREAQWPKDADDPVLNSAWSKAMERLLRIERCAEDAINEQIESRFTPEAVAVCKGLLTRLNNLVVVLAVPESQRGVVKKLIQHAVKLALLHRCLRWAAGEFGERGPLGDVDADDAIAACDATLFFFGRWLIWRKELRAKEHHPGDTTIGLAGAPGSDPVLQPLADFAADAQRSIRLIEKLVRYARAHSGTLPQLNTLAGREPFADAGIEELQAACAWLVEARHGRWCEDHPDTLSLATVGTQSEKGTRTSAAYFGDPS